MEFSRTSAPISLAAKLTVLTVPEMREHIRISHDYEDRLLEGFIDAAYDLLAGPQGWLGHCCLLPESFVAYTDSFTTPVELPMRPVMSGGLQAVDTVDADGVYATTDSTRYRLVVGEPFSSLKGYMGEPLRGVTRNGLTGFDPLAYRVNFVAGFGPNRDDIPAGIRQAMKLLVGHMYQNREQTFADVRISTVNREIEFGMRALAGRYRIEPDHS